MAGHKKRRTLPQADLGVKTTATQATHPPGKAHQGTLRVQ